MRRKPEPTGLLFEEPEEVLAAAPSVCGDFYAEVAIQRPLDCLFTYSVPLELRARVEPGVRVAVPFGHKREVGVVVGTRAAPPAGAPRLKPLFSVLDEEPLFDAAMLQLTRWMAEEYACSWGEALSAVMPSALKREAGARQVVMIRLREELDEERAAALEKSQPKQFRMLRTLRELEGPIELRELCRRLNVTEGVGKSLARGGFAWIERVVSRNDPLATSSVQRRRPDALTHEQQAAVTTLEAALADGKGGAFLLQGVTGSGKTEIYLRLIESALAAGKGAIVMVPEIALTPQTVGWFRSRFGEVAVLHSRMTDAQRRAMWLSVKHRRTRVVVGARSAGFAPVPDLGVIVLDEEHEPSFKQESTPRYHARAVALRRAAQANAVCVLGSATPSLESWQAAQEGRLKRIVLRERVQGIRLPPIEVLDLRQEKSDHPGPPLFTRRLLELVGGALERGEQAILFQNRRGFSPVLWCAACGETVRCSQCDSNLTFHRRIARVVCHSCCEELPVPRACPMCTAPNPRHLGAGSERVELLVKKLYPAARVQRMDSDTMLRREDYEDALERFGRGEIDVLVGTQMIAKGLDFPRVTVVGVVNADQALHLPDFRASERTFQLLAQVAGRAGRGLLDGRIVVQSATPSHPAIVAAAKHDYEGFARAESRLRAELGYPPHGRLLRTVIDSEDLGKLDEVAQAVGKLLREAVGTAAQVLGPAEAPIALLRGRHRKHVLVKARRDSDGVERARAALRAYAVPHAKVRVSIDVDPVSML
ncbi:MAG: primosomal protein N' [Planctomycetes bacterium]|nr:primosomal protein N' [Planctomycetota bacterium]